MQGLQYFSGRVGFLQIIMNILPDDMVILKIDQGKSHFFWYATINVLFSIEGPLREHWSGVEEREQFTIIHDVDPGLNHLEKTRVNKVSS